MVLSRKKNRKEKQKKNKNIQKKIESQKAQPGPISIMCSRSTVAGVKKKFQSYWGGV